MERCSPAWSWPFAASGKAIHFEAFRQYLIAGEEPASYVEVAAGLELTEAAVKVAVHRARRRFGRLLREQIAQTVAASGAELATLKSRPTFTPLLL